MIEIEIICISKYESPWTEELIYVSDDLVLIVVKTVLANREKGPRDHDTEY
jgi:hypothetical protein